MTSDDEPQSEPQKLQWEHERLMKKRQDWREERALFLDEWRQYVAPIYENHTEAQRLGTQYAQIALRGAFLTNSGALISLPPLMTWLKVAGGSNGAAAAMWFVGGLLLAAIAALIAYFNFMALSEVYNARATSTALRLYRRFYPDAYQDEMLKKADADETRWDRWTNATRRGAIVVGLLSYVCLIAGVWAFKHLIS